ncbi:MAG TPA: hypothetical protein VH372_10555 [Actinospica sp.]|jgi:hypothetical protein|nr:hypothetical protein [Actinospica sp.]
MDPSRLGRTEQVLTVGGLLLLLFSFFPWFSATVNLGVDGSVSGHADAWSDPSGFIDWFPILLLFAYAVVLALPAFGAQLSAPLLAHPPNRAFIGLVLCAFAVLLFAIQGLTYPSLPAGYSGSAGPSWAYYLCLVIALGAGVQSYLGFIRQGGSFAQVGAAFQARTSAVQQQGANPYGQPPQQGGVPYGQQPPAPYPPQNPYPQPQPSFGGQPQDPQQPYSQQPPPPAAPYGS